MELSEAKVEIERLQRKNVNQFIAHWFTHPEKTAIRASREQDQRSVAQQSSPTVRARQVHSRRMAVSRGSFPYGSSGDIGNRVIGIGERQVGMPGPTRGSEQRTALGGERRPQPQVLEITSG